MISKKLLIAIRKIRAQYPDAYNTAQALRYAREEIKRKPRAKFDGRTCSWKQDGFDLAAKIADDDSPDLSWLGEFTDDRNAPGAIKRHNPGRQEFRYFAPANTEEDHYRELRIMKCGRTVARELAREYVRRDWQRVERYGNDWYSVGVIVTASRNGVELAQYSVWGIESDAGEYLETTAEELAAEAIREARAKLETLCKPARRKAATR